MEDKTGTFVWSNGLTMGAVTRPKEIKFKNFLKIPLEVRREGEVIETV